MVEHVHTNNHVCKRLYSYSYKQKRKRRKKERRANEIKCAQLIVPLDPVQYRIDSLHSGKSE